MQNTMGNSSGKDRTIEYNPSFKDVMTDILTRVREFLRENAIPDAFILDAEVSAPVLYGFSVWILKKAKEDGIRRLYFLARDAYVPWMFSKTISEKEGLGIECRYLYCSRRSLRVPCLHLLDTNSKLQMLGAPAQNITGRRILRRICNDEETDYFLSKWGISCGGDTPLTRGGREEFLKNAGRDEDFIQLTEERSRKEYGICREYFLQEKLTDGSPIAVVDSGWTGSMQHCLRILLESMGCRQPITGYYYGLYEKTHADDGKFSVFDFNADNPVRRIVKFNNNLFEVMSYGPGGMTTFYEKDGGRVIPHFSANNNADGGNREKLFIKFCDLATERKLYLLMNNPGTYEWVKKTMRRISYQPSVRQAEFYGNLHFTDDILDFDQRKLAPPLKKSNLHSLVFPVRMYYYLFRKKTIQLSFWDFGSVVLSRSKLHGFYRWNILLWERIRLMRNRNKGNKPNCAKKKNTD